MLKKFFGKKEEEREYTIDDLIVLERYEEAEARLRERMQTRDDIHDHLKLADVHLGSGSVAKAVDEFLYVADKYADDGFYEKALAALTKARRLNPMDDTIPARIRRMELARSLERKRDEALAGFLEGRQTSETRGTAVVEFQSMWRHLIDTRIARDLTGEQLGLLFKGSETVHVNSGKTMVERGSRDEALYVITSGDLVAQIGRPGGSMMDLRTFGGGQVVGESTLFEHRPWAADYVARSRTSLLRLDQAGLEVCLTGNPDPRGFLDVLRKERNDQEVAKLVAATEG